MHNIIVPLADGFEEMEAVAVIDILRRAGIQVFVAGVDGMEAVGSHGIHVVCDGPIEECRAERMAGIVLPGGMPGTTNLAKNADVRRLIERAHESGKIVAAICAAPVILAQMGLLKGRSATSHPKHAGELGECSYLDEAVVVDGNVVTSRGAGTAIYFAAELVKIIAGGGQAEKMLEAIVAK